MVIYLQQHRHWQVVPVFLRTAVEGKRPRRLESYLSLSVTITFCMNILNMVHASRSFPGRARPPHGAPIDQQRRVPSNECPISSLLLAAIPLLTMLVCRHTRAVVDGHAASKLSQSIRFHTLGNGPAGAGEWPPRRPLSLDCVEPLIARFVIGCNCNRVPCQRAMMLSRWPAHLPVFSRFWRPVGKHFRRGRATQRWLVSGGHAI
jgi:hypothetical protein